MKTLRNMWERHAHRYPDREALLFEEKRVTYRELLGRGRKLGSAIEQAGAKRQDRIAMLAMNCAEWMDFYVACDVSGYIATTVNFRLSPAEIHYILENSGPAVLIFEAQYAETIAGLRARLPRIRHYVCIGARLDWAMEFEEFLGSGSEAGGSTVPVPEDYVRLVYTSGTTGRPKGAVKTQAAELRVAEKIATIMDMNGSTSILLMMPMFHVGAQLEQIGQHWAGGTVVLQRRFDTRAIVETIARERVSIVHMAPTMLQTLLNEQDLGAYDLRSLETFCYAAAPMPVRVLRHAVTMLGPIFCDMYGSTEIGPTTMLYKHLHDLDGGADAERRLGSVGQSVPGTEIRIVDDKGHDCPAGQPGEVLIKSNSMFSGYWSDSAASVEAIVDGWYASGDIGLLDENDYLYLVDRKKDMIISGGENIYCREVEEALMAHPDVADVAVIGVPDEKWGEAVRAIVVPVEDATIDTGALIAFCRERIAGYKVPKHIVVQDSLPRLPSGKVSKVLLRETVAAAGGALS